MGSSGYPPSSTLEHSRRRRELHKDLFYEDRDLPRPSEKTQVADGRESSVNGCGPGSSAKNLQFIAAV